MFKTPLFDWHSTNGGRVVDFAGWAMPVQYSTIVKEHQAVRKAAGIFDISHMGRLVFCGAQNVEFLDHLVTNDVAALKVGAIRYALITNEGGGILDDVLVYRRESDYLMVVNASNRQKILDWIAEQRAEFEFEFEDQTQSTAMVAIQGPAAIGILSSVTSIDLSAMKYYSGVTTEVMGQAAYVSRTGYTGEDGFEVIVSQEQAVELWTTLLSNGANAGLVPAGLGCRDTLRLEAAMPLYGHELSEDIDPYTAGLSFAVKLKSECVGHTALQQLKADDTLKKRVGLVLEGKRIAREGALVFAGDERIGSVTSGTFSPTLQKPIAMAYVPPEWAKIGTDLEIDIRGKRVAAQITSLPFYRRS